MAVFGSYCGALSDNNYGTGPRYSCSIHCHSSCIPLLNYVVKASNEGLSYLCDNCRNKIQT